MASPETPESTRQKVVRLCGETTREIGLLIVVFLPLDFAVESAVRNGGVGVEPTDILKGMSFGLVLVAIGIWCEVDRGDLDFLNKLDKLLDKWGS